MVDFLTLARERLTAGRTYFVRSDGNDANNGLANTPAGAYLTIPQAVNAVAGLDIGTQAVTIQVADGTYTGPVVVNGPWLGSGVVTLQGNTTNPANVFINVTANAPVTVQNGGSLTIKGFKLAGTGGFGAGLKAVSAAAVLFDRLDFGASDRQIQASLGGNITSLPGATYTISAGGVNHFFSSSGGTLAIEATTITLTGTPAFSGAFANCSNLGMGFLDGDVFIGPATGPRYLAAAGGVIATGGGGANYFPGNAAGTAVTGQYS